MESNQFEVMCEALYALKLGGLLLDLLSTTDAEKIKSLRLFDDIKFMIGHKLNRLIKEPFIENAEIELLYSKLFDEKFPILSDFYESNFFNPCLSIQERETRHIKYQTSVRNLAKSVTMAHWYFILLRE